MDKMKRKEKGKNISPCNENARIYPLSFPIYYSAVLATVIITYITSIVVIVQSPSHVWLCDHMDCSTPGLPVPHHLPDFAQVHVPCISDDIQPSHPLMSSSPSAINLSQHQGLFHWVSYSHQMNRILEFQLQLQSCH